MGGGGGGVRGEDLKKEGIFAKILDSSDVVYRSSSIAGIAPAL